MSKASGTARILSMYLMYIMQPTMPSETPIGARVPLDQSIKGAKNNEKWDSMLRR